MQKHQTSLSPDFLKSGLEVAKAKKAFTLVELIIVITILAILATIAFVSFSNYTASARDANRVATLTNIEKWLQTFQISSGKYPIPDETINVTDSWTIIGYQWTIWESVSKIIKISNIPTDPQDGFNYVYSRNERWNKYQIMGFLEVQNSQTAFIKESYADISQRFPITKWDKLWIILEENNVPVTTDIDVRNHSWSTLTTYISQDKNFTWTWETLKTLISNFKAGKTWTELDWNCDIDDIVIWNQIWAGCNSTLWNWLEWWKNEDGTDGIVATCFDYSWNSNTLNCPVAVSGNSMFSSSKESAWTETNWSANANARVDNIWGKLYLWNNSPSACPEWWRVPSDDDFKNLERYLGCSEWDINGTMGIRCSWLWWIWHTSKNKQNNITQALILPSSWIRSLNQTFVNRGRDASFFTSTSSWTNMAYGRIINWLNDSITRGIYDTWFAAAIRCIKN